MNIDGWKYYNHAAIPSVAICDDPDTSAVENGDIWKLDGSPIIARWTTDFDKIDGGEWWYIIKDTPLDISKLKAKRRYEINKGIKNFDVEQINPMDFKEELFYVQVEAFSAYPAKYRPTVEKESFFKELESWNDLIVLGTVF